MFIFLNSQFGVKIKIKMSKNFIQNFFYNVKY